jgi:hypothetical protein
MFSQTIAAHGADKREDAGSLRPNHRRALHSRLVCGILTLVSTNVLLLTLILVADAQQPAHRPSPVATELPADLAVVPSDTALLLCFDLTRYWTGAEAESLKRLSNTHPVVPTWWFRDMPAATGVQPENIVRMMQFSGPFEAVSVLTTRQPYDRAKVLAALAPEAAEKSAGGKIYFHSAKSKNSVFPLNDRTLLIGMGNDLQGFLARNAPLQRDESLDRALIAAVNGAPIVIHAGPAFIKSIVADQHMREGPLEPLARAHAWQIIAENNKRLTIKLLADFATNDQAAKATPALKIIREKLSNLIPFYKSNMTPSLKEQAAQYPGAKELGPKMTAALDATSEALKHVDFRSLNNRAGAQIEIDTNEPLTTAVLLLTLTPRAAK